MLHEQTQTVSWLLRVFHWFPITFKLSRKLILRYGSTQRIVKEILGKPFGKEFHQGKAVESRVSTMVQGEVLHLDPTGSTREFLVEMLEVLVVRWKRVQHPMCM